MLNMKSPKKFDSTIASDNQSFFLDEEQSNVILNISEIINDMKEI